MAIKLTNYWGGITALGRIFVLFSCGFGLSFSLLGAVVTPGFVIGWGENISGEATGTPSVTFTNGEMIYPRDTHSTGTVLIANHVLTDAIALSAYSSLSLALRRDGSAVGWGENSLGQALGVKSPYPGKASGDMHLRGQMLSNLVSISAGGGFGAALHANGSIVNWGEKAVTLKLTNVTSLVAGCYARAWAVLEDGSVAGWDGEKSHPDYGQLLPVPALSNITSIAIGEATHGPRAIALKRDGTVALFWEDRSLHKYHTPPIGLSNVTAVAAGSGHTLALKKDSTVIGWGFNRVGEATGTPKTNVVNSDYYSSGQVTLGGKVLSNVVAIAANSGYSMALKNDGTVVVWGRIQNNLYPATAPAGLSNVVAIAAGQFHSLAITTNAAVAERFRAEAK